MVTIPFSVNGLDTRILERQQNTRSFHVPITTAQTGGTFNRLESLETLNITCVLAVCA